MEYLNTYPWIIAPLIFMARIVDVSLGTVRTIIVFRGYRILAAIIGFFEVSIWILAAGQVMKNLNELHLIVAYAGGFATGNMIGIWLEAKLAIGNALVRAISANSNVHLSRKLREYKYFVIEVYGKGENADQVEISFIVEKRRKLPDLLKLIEETDSNIFYTVEDVRDIHNTNIEIKKEKAHRSFLNMWSKKK